MKGRNKAIVTHIVVNMDSFIFINLFILFTYFWLHSVVIDACGLSLVAARVRATLHCGSWASHCSGFSCCGAQALGAQASVVVARGLSSCGSRALGSGSVSEAHGLSCSAACGIFPNQGSNPCPLHWQVDS